MRGVWLGFAALGLALIAAPFVFTGDYHHSVLITLLIYLILLMGLNLVSGFGRQLSLAQAGLYGLGAYTAGIAAAKLNLPPLLAFGLAPVVVAVVTAIVGFPSLRLRGLYFSMATLGTGMVLYLIFSRAVALTGGPNGLLGIPAFSVFGYRLGTPFAMYWLCAAAAFLGLLGTYNLVRSRMGRALRALGISEPGAAAVGVDISHMKLMVFVLSGVYAGVAGALQTFQARFISPETFSFFPTVIFVVVLTLGGMGTVWGPLVGAGLLTALDELLTAVPDYKPLILGVTFLIVIQAFPLGLVGALERWWERSREAAGGGIP